jgi:hypothetical protein
MTEELADHQLDPEIESDDSPPATPRWVKLLGVIVLVIVLIFAGLHLLGGGLGPGTHMPVQHGQP